MRNLDGQIREKNLLVPLGLYNMQEVPVCKSSLKITSSKKHNTRFYQVHFKWKHVSLIDQYASRKNLL